MNAKILKDAVVALLAVFVTFFFCRGSSLADTHEDAGYRPLKEVILKARDRVFPALVHITVVEGDFSGGKEVKVLAVGSGVIVTQEGHVVTNHHVAGKGKHFICTLSDKQEVKADLVGKDPLTDLAVIKLRLDERKDRSRQVTVALLGDSDSVEVGEYVMAMGSPLALARSVTLGVVGNVERVFPYSENMELDDEEPTGIVTRWIQHDSSINPGNSGGPLVNMEGEVIGINELSAFWGGDLGFAIPSNLVKEVVDSIVKNGKVSRSFIGVEVQPLPKDFKTREGILICGVMKDSPAEKSGIKPGDIISEFDGKAVRGKFPEEVPLFTRLVTDTPVGKSVEIKLLRRDGNAEKVMVTTEEMEEHRGDEKEARGWGITVRALTRFSVWERLLDSREGVIVTGVRAGGAAAQAKPSLQPGDIIHKMGDKDVKDINDFFSSYEALRSSESENSVLLELERNSERLLTALKPPEETDREERALELPKAWLPVRTQVLTRNLASALNLEGMTGVRITQVYPVKEAVSDLLHTGDIILKIDGEEIPATLEQDVDVFPAMVRLRRIGETVKLTIFREGKETDVQVPLTASPALPKDAARYKDKFLELNARAVTFYDRVREKLKEDEKGVIVESVESGGWAALAGVMTGDVIVKLGEIETPGIGAYQSAVEGLAKDPPDVIHIVVRRGPRFRFLETYSVK